jgi:hypothetical protein
MGNQVFSNDTIPKTVLSIVQGKDSLVITDKTKEIVLSTDSFKLYFTTQNTDCVFLNCSYDSMAYHYASINQLEKIETFKRKGARRQKAILQSPVFFRALRFASVDQRISYSDLLYWWDRAFEL